MRSGAAALHKDRIRAFIEVHIEQAPSLAEAGFAIGIGSAIPGNFRYPEAKILGEYGHVGLPRRFRHDAALAGADFAVALDKLWAQWEGAGRPMACTIGEFHTDRARHAMTKVAGEFSFSLDVRAYRAQDIDELTACVAQIVSEIESRRGVKFLLGRRTEAEVATAEPGLMWQMEDCATQLGIPALRLESPASHDAASFFAAGIPFALLFIRNANGSHHKDEDMDIGDFLLATAVLSQWLATHACSEAGAA